MLTLTFVVFVSLLQLAVTANAFVRCWKDAFPVGWMAAIARMLLMLGGAGAGVRIFFASLASRDSPPPPLAALIALVAMVLGPILSFAALWAAHRRRANVPAVDEERLGRPFAAWLPVALFDAAFVTINVLANVVA